MGSRNATSDAGQTAWFELFAFVFGMVLGVALLKFPNPPVLEHLIERPSNTLEWLIMPWPVKYGHAILLAVALLGVAFVRWPQRASRWPRILPVLWFAWIALSCLQTVDIQLSIPTTIHFAACLCCYYLGLGVIGRLQRTGWFIAGLFGAFLAVLAVGWQQRFGGLEESRNYFFTYIYPSLSEVPPELLKKMQTNRIFSTLFYPNSLAGAILLLSPAILGVIAGSRERLTEGARWFLLAAIGGAAAACLAWSGSKAGWLVALLMAAAALFKLPVQRRLRIVLASVILVAGIAGFTGRYFAFFQKGATSVVARFDYWQAAARNAAGHPILGSGPGTFGTVYKNTKSPGAEMSRLVHNDYLQQASDSGVIAGGLFLAMIISILLYTGRGWLNSSPGAFGVWLGLAGFALQAVVEFGFYVPATAWIWFALAGWMVGRNGLRFDNPRPSV